LSHDFDGQLFLKHLPECFFFHEFVALSSTRLAACAGTLGPFPAERLPD